MSDGRIHRTPARARHSRDDPNCGTGFARPGACCRSALERSPGTGWVNSEGVDSRILPVETASLPIHSIAYEGNGTRGILIVNKLSLRLNDVPKSMSLR